MKASVQRIKSLTPAMNADRIEMASLADLFWTAVVKKGEFTEGDLCVYISIDSLVPESAPWAAFLSSTKFRVRTIRLRGNLSQGLILPVHVLPAGVTPEVGMDVSEILGVAHYEKPVPLHVGGDIRGDFPSVVSKTDEPMLQNYPGILRVMAGQECYATVKCDGTSGTFLSVDGDIHVCSRNWSMKDTEKSVLWSIFSKYGMSAIFHETDNLAIQGEVVGPGIQKNPMSLPSADIRVFNVWSIKEGRYFGMAEMARFCEQYGLPMVPIVDVFVMPEDATVELFLKKAEGKYPGTENHREGIVVRTTTPMHHPSYGRLSFKALNNTFLEIEK